MLVATGNTGAAIASRLFIAESTVRWQLDELRQRLGAKNTTHALTICISRGYIFIDVDAQPHAAEPIEELLAAA